jgi:hypothetical protein
VSGADAYLRELRRALPLGCRRRFVAEMREHFESAVAAEAQNGVERDEAERLTIERLGPARELADQLLADLRSGALGPAARVSAALTATRIVLAAALVGAVVVGIAVTTLRSTSTSPPPRTVQRMPQAEVVRNGVPIRRLILTLAKAQPGVRVHTLPGGYVVPVRIHLTPAP